MNNFQSKTKRWRTGQVNSSNPLAATYSAAAPPLLPNAAVQWRVRVWTTSNTSIPTNWSAYSSFRVGKNEQDWIGKWITSSANDEERVNDQAYDENCTTSAFGDHPNFLFRRLFHAGSNVTRATLHVVGLGYYRVSIDGSLVPGDTFLDPPWTSFDRTVSSAMLDVTSLFRGHARQHIIEVELGNGWWNPLPLKFWGSIDVSQHLPTGKPMFRLDLILETSSKNMIVISSSDDGTWQTTDGAWIRNNIYLGTKFDQQRSNIISSNVASWSNENVVLASTKHVGRSMPQTIPPIRCVETLTGSKMLGRSSISDINEVWDLGRNFAGIPNVTFHGPMVAGTTIRFRYGEILFPNGTVNGWTSVAGQIKKKGMGGVCAPDVAYQEDIYVSDHLNEGDVVSFVPRFTWHGFRYIEITRVDMVAYTNDTSIISASAVHQVDGIVLRTDVDVAGTFRVVSMDNSSVVNHTLDQIFAMCRRTLASNMMSIQSDCPHRERFGYGGDLLATANAGMHLFDMSSFYSKRVQDYSDAQRSDGALTETAPFVGISNNGVGGQLNDGSGPIGWATVQPVLQKMLHQHYGDTHTALNAYNATQRWIEMLQNVPEGPIENGLSDWMNVEPSNVRSLTGHVFLSQNYAAWSSLNRFFGRKDVAIKYERMANKTIERMNHLFLQANGTYSKFGEFGLTQCGQSMPYYFDMVPNKMRDLVAFNLNIALQENVVPASSVPFSKKKMAVGMFCIEALLMSLDVTDAYDIVANNQEYPSYGWMISHGATTLWESWFYSNNTYSHNHPMFSSVVVWMFQRLGGINQAEGSVGWSHILLRPRSPCGGEGNGESLPGVEVALQTVRGRVDSNWTRNGNNETSFAWSFRIPDGTVATIDTASKPPFQVGPGAHIMEDVNLCDEV